MIIGLTGGNASGKGEAAKYLETLGFKYHSLSDVIRAELARDGLESSRENMIERGNSLRRAHGPAYLAENISRFFTGRDIVDSIRNPAEVEALRRNGGFVLVALSAPPEVRFRRAMERGRNENASTLAEFVANENRENTGNPDSQRINACVAMADRHISNDGTLEQLYAKIDEVLK